jgi:Fanconi anemia group M protein
VFIKHPLIRQNSIDEREYQTALANSCLESSTLIVLPTGMGKTVVALIVMAKTLERKKGKVVFLAPTKPLVEQHSKFVGEHLVGNRVVALTGEVEPSEREVAWIENDVIVSTPQVVANDLRSERISLRDVKLIIFDEAHRGVGNYAYVAIGEEYKAYDGLVMGMTASPGSSGRRIEEVCSNLGIVKTEVRSESDPDVAKYVQDVNMQWVEVDVPDQMRKVSNILRSLNDSYIKELVNLGVMDSKRPPSRKYLLEVRSRIQSKLDSGERRRQLYRALSVQAMAMKIGHALELGETQGTTALTSYLERMVTEATSEDGSKASRAIVRSPEFEKIISLLGSMKMEHPKLSRVMSIVSNQIIAHPNSRILVFTHYRDTCELVTNKLSKIEGAKVAKLIGQAESGSDKGLKQKEQVGVLEKFRRGENNVLVATSVGEEGLDVASTDLVIFYEPVPSEIRTIQRRGRTGRRSPGRVVIMITRGTMDEAYLHSSQRKESAMRRRLYRLSEKHEEKKTLENHEEKPEHGEGQKSIFDF